MVPARTVVTLYPVNLALPAVLTRWRFSAVTDVLVVVVVVVVVVLVLNAGLLTSMFSSS